MSCIVCQLNLHRCVCGVPPHQLALLHLLVEHNRDSPMPPSYSRSPCGHIMIRALSVSCTLRYLLFLVLRDGFSEPSMLTLDSKFTSRVLKTPSCGLCLSCTTAVADAPHSSPIHPLMLSMVLNLVHRTRTRVYARPRALGLVQCVLFTSVAESTGIVSDGLLSVCVPSIVIRKPLIE